MSLSNSAYLAALLRVNHIDLILSALGFTEQASLIRQVLKKSPGPPGQVRRRRRRLRLLTTISNIRKVIPEDFVRDFAAQDIVRNRLSAVYRRAFRPQVAKRISGCGEAFMTFDSACPPHDDATLVPYSCNQRSCPACSRHRSALLFARVLDHLSPRIQIDPASFDLRWLTLDIRSPPWGELAQGLTDLLHAFRRLRSHDSPLWTDHVDGYIFNTEITCNPATRSWHPHIHAVITGDYIPGATLNARWRAQVARRDRGGHATIGRCYVKDLTAPEGRRYPAHGAWSERDLLGCLLEVTKYTLKPFESSRVPDAAILELHDALHNRRGTGSGGTLRIPGDHPRPYWRKLSGLGAMIDNPLSRIYTDSAFSRNLIAAATRDPRRWAILIRNYPDAYWLQVIASSIRNQNPLT